MIDFDIEPKKTKKKVYVYVLAREDTKLEGNMIQPYIQLAGKVLQPKLDMAPFYEAYPAFSSAEDAQAFAVAVVDQGWKVLRMEVAI